MTHYIIQVDLHLDGKWHTSMETTGRKWRQDLALHRRHYSEPARAIKLKTVRKLRVLK